MHVIHARNGLQLAACRQQSVGRPVSEIASANGFRETGDSVQPKRSLAPRAPLFRSQAMCRSLRPVMPAEHANCADLLPLSPPEISVLALLVAPQGCYVKR